MSASGPEKRSHWAWGFEGRFPDDDARRLLATQVSMLLGIDEPALRPLPSLGDARLPEPRVAPPDSLLRIASSDREARIRHTYGRSFRDLVRGFRGDFASAPDWVASPETEDDVAALLVWCGQEGVAAIPFGGGTSVVGGVEAAVGPRFSGAVSIDMTKMNRVLEIDAVSRAARIQAGALGPSIEAALAPHGLTLRHFPQSFEHSTLGGWLATRAGGHFATLYTHIDDLVESIRMVTPRGVLASRRLPASGAGPSPDRLVLGSEGIFGVITEAWMRLQSRPRFRASASVHFDSFEQGVLATRAIAQSGLYPSNCRLIDKTEALLNTVATDGEAVLLLAFESADHELSAWIDRAIAIAKDHAGRCPRGPVFRDEGAEARSAEANAAYKQSFFRAPYLQSAIVSLGLIVDTFETACTWDRFEALDREVREAVTEAMQKACGGGLLARRFTHVYPDGPAPYYTFVASRGSGDRLESWEKIKEAASSALVKCGATITHHHAVGRLHRPWYDEQRPEPFAEALRAAKGALDPCGICNPGVLVDQ